MLTRRLLGAIIGRQFDSAALQTSDASLLTP
jgi:hypothetical protein